MIYRNYFKKGSKAVKSILPEGVTAEQLKIGIREERLSTNDTSIAAKIALKHLKEDATYYSKLSEAGNDGEDNDCDCGAQDCVEHRPHSDSCNVYKNDGVPVGPDSPEIDEDVDDNGGLPKMGGALAIPHVGQPIHMSKIIQVGATTGKSASGELSGYTACGVKSDGDKETITAGGKKVDGSIATKSVGGEVVSGEGQEQGGPNHGGQIAGTSKIGGSINESKKSRRELVKESLKSIRFDKKSGKWVKLNEVKLDMKMGASYKVVQPNLTQTSDVNKSRENQYDPHITEMQDEEEDLKMENRYNELVNAKRNLSESELEEMNVLDKKMQEASYKIVQPNLTQTSAVNKSRENQYDPEITENEDEFDKFADTHGKLSKFGDKPLVGQRKDLAKPGQWLAEPEDVETHIGSTIGKAGEDFLANIHKDTDKPDADLDPSEKEDRYDDKFDNSPYTGRKGDKPPLGFEPDFLKRRKKVAGATEPDEDDDLDEAGGGVVQHKNFRTVNDLPQKSKIRWSNEMAEATEKKPKESETAKQIKKSAKGSSPEHKPDNLKFKPSSSKTAKSGVEKKK